jgi:hypothetical protein
MDRLKEALRKIQRDRDKEKNIEMETLRKAHKEI